MTTETDNKNIYPTVESYDTLSQNEHPRKCPGMYIGDISHEDREEWILDPNSRVMHKHLIDFPRGCERLFIEVISNASDNAWRSQHVGVNPGPIEILMNNKTISIKNGGLPIPVEIKPEWGVYVPEKIFGTMLSSSNFGNEERHGAGVNGIGVKAVNIFSAEFCVIIHDHIRKLKYTQIWHDGMQTCYPPTIEPYEGPESSVQVLYVLDFEYFGYEVPNETNGTGGYPTEAICLFARHAADISFTAKVPVTFNGQSFDYTNIRDYARMYHGDIVDTGIVHYEWSVGTEIIKSEKGEKAVNNTVPLWECIILDTPDHGQEQNHISFVNCMMTQEGGIHVNIATKIFSDYILDVVNRGNKKTPPRAKANAKSTKGSKAKKSVRATKSKQPRRPTLTMKDVKNHMSMIISVRVTDPLYRGQTKDFLSSGGLPLINVLPEEVKTLPQWEIILRLQADLDAKVYVALTKTDGKKRKHVSLKDGIDANEAGTKNNWKNCVLYITEGKSGKGYANKLVSLIPNGRDFIGILPLRGKCLNVMKASTVRTSENAEFAEIKKALGLKEKVDYTNDANFAELRYGSILIMTDSDVDGKHIMGLIINYFYCCFPTLIARGFIMHYRSPIIRVQKNKEIIKFYNEREYELWKEQTNDYCNWDHKYYKGLGTSKDSEIKDDYRTPHVVTCVYDAETPYFMELAFGKTNANCRKKWINDWQPETEIIHNSLLPISNFVDKELVLFSRDDVIRSIPKLMDGFKECQRKIIHGTFLHWKNIKPGNITYKQFKVAQLGASVSEKTHYQHGEDSLSKAIINMAQDFVGSNNIPLLTREGQFGSRFEGGQDASAPRYVFTKPEYLLPYIIRKEDENILEPLITEGDPIEPNTYYPVIPLILINGAEGIATGWSTKIPCHNPLDIINYLRMKLMGVPEDDLPFIQPWYRGFTGEIRLINRRRQPVTNISENPDLEDPYVVDINRQCLSMEVSCNFYVDNRNDIIIDELPLNISPFSYGKWLDELCDKKLISGYRDTSVDNTVHFEISGYCGDFSHKALRLIQLESMSNMQLLDEDNRVISFDTANDILDSFYAHRLPIYQKRKDFILPKKQKEITDRKYKIRYIEAVLANQINIMNARKQDIYQKLDELNIPHEYYNKAKQSHLSQDEIHSLQEEIRKLEEEYRILEETPIEKMWLDDLDELEKAYRFHYKISDN